LILKIILKKIKSDKRHVSKNGNIWFACNYLNNKEKNVMINLNSSIIDKPKENYLYVFNKKIKNTLFEKTLIIGKIKIIAKTFDEKNVTKVEFYINNIKIHEDNNKPYDMIWNTRSFSKYNLKIKTYYNDGKILKDEMQVYKIL